MEKLNNYLAMFSNLAVLAGIVFLGLEIQQNTNMMQSQTRSDLTRNQIDWLMAIGTDEYAANALNRCNRDALESESAELLSCNLINNANLRIWENEWYQYEQGLFEEEEFQARRDLWGSILSNPDSTTRMAYSRTRANYSLGFQKQIDQLIENVEQ